ncbi:hypothetical protein [Pareuzebyella sediminis]|uniref:hypothetical protein n=1 Tax=Pareuzebyella sediminis TaxID=2607998 RepID=UPI0011ECE54E|nr:hypothetical protein [Pareuzebyella sediminis]
MEKNELDRLFEQLRGRFDLEEPKVGHTDRFLEKLNTKKGVTTLRRPKNRWQRPVAIAASFVILLTTSILFFNSQTSLEEQVAEISPEASKSENYFASIIDEQIKQLEKETTPETQRIIEDTMVQMEKLELDYNNLEKDLIKGGNNKLILSAMITNFQTRIDLLQDVLKKIETIKTLKNYDNANTTF